MGRTLHDILTTDFSIKTTLLEQQSLKDLINKLESLKNEINDVYNAETNQFADSTALFFARDILQEIHNRICIYFRVKPTVVNVEPYDFYLHKIAQGTYSFKTREIYLGMLVNFKTYRQTYLFNHLSDAWAEHHLRNLFHETYHHIQMEMLRKLFYEGAKVPKRFENEIKMILVYFENYKEFDDKIFDYYLNPLEMPARKFAKECMDFLKTNNYVVNKKEYEQNNAYNVFNEMEIVGENFENLNTSKNNWLESNLHNSAKLTVNNFYNDMFNYYFKLKNESEIVTNNLKSNKEINMFCELYGLSSLKLLALSYDYEKYLNCENKNNFLYSIKNSNMEANLYGMNAKVSYLPLLLIEIQKQKLSEKDEEKE